MPVPLSPTLASGLLVAEGPRLARLTAEAERARAHLEAKLGAIGAAHRARQEAVAAWRQGAVALRRAHQALAEANQRRGRLGAEVDALRRRAQDLLVALRQSEDAHVQIALRQERAQLLVAIEDRRAGEQQAIARVESLAAQAAEVEQAQAERQVARARTQAELAGLQGGVPRPGIFLALAEARLGAAHCGVVTGDAAERWRARMREVVGEVVGLHQAAAHGMWPLERHGELTAGRAVATVEALSAQVVLGDLEGARALFDLACPAGLCFHHILLAFRAWCLGLTLHGQQARLGQLLEDHQDDPGLRGTYARAYLALAAGDGVVLAAQIEALCRAEWASWQRHRVRGMGAVNLGALALWHLARRQGLRLAVDAPNLPPALWPAG